MSLNATDKNVGINNFARVYSINGHKFTGHFSGWVNIFTKQKFGPMSGWMWGAGIL